MSKILSNKSRLNTSLVLCMSGLLVMAGMILTHIQVGAWAVKLAVYLQVIAVFVVCVVGFMLQQPLTNGEYHLEGQREYALERRRVRAWEDIRVTKVTFRLLSPGSKALFLFFVFAGVGLFIYGILDAAGMIPAWRMPSTRGLVTIPIWISAMMEMLLGLSFVAASRVVFVNFTSRAEESLEQFLQEEGIRVK